MKNTNLLRDEPAREDAFGAHEQIADEIVRLIQSDGSTDQPRSVGLLGEWGSGKSSVVYMMRSKLAKLEGSAQRFHVFIYDAWAHQGDELRRAFLDTLVENLGGIIGEKKDELRKRIWQKEETIETKSHQVLRRHGKLLLGGLILSPISLRLYQSPPDNFDYTAKCIWNYITFFGIFLPFLSLVTLYLVKIAPFSFPRKWLLGTDKVDEINNLKISNVFFQRTEGQIDKKTTTSPSDSIREFNNIFRSTCIAAVESGRKLIFVIDNIDRLDHEATRLFWSTMQSFIDRATWQHDEASRSVFYIVPFSPSAVRSAFDAGHDNDRSSQSFIDKTFDLSIRVPPSIQVDLRAYLVKLLRTAFPEHDDRSLEAVRDLYDYHRSNQSELGRAGDTEISRRTPRQMKLFVNQLVALYRLRGDALALETMAAYLLCQIQIDKDGLHPDRYLSPQQTHLLPSRPDIVQQMAAVHFGVSLEAAAQVILFEPIQRALSPAGYGALERLSARSGFADVLKLAIAAMDGSASVHDALRLAVVLSVLPDAKTSDFGQVWNAVLNNIRHANQLGAVDEDAVDGVGVLLQHLHESQRQVFFDVLRRGLSGAWITLERQKPKASDEKSEAFESRMAIAESIGKIAQKLAEMSALETLGQIVLPTHAGFATRLVEAISRSTSWRDIASSLKLRIVFGNVPQTIIVWPGIAFGPLAPHDFVKTADVVEGYDPDWPNTAGLIVESIEASISNPQQTEVSVRLALSVASLHPQVGLEKAIRELFINGSLSVPLEETSDDSVSGAALAAFLTFAPAVTPASLVLPTGRPATALISILQADDLSETILEHAIETILTIGKANAVLLNSAQYPAAKKPGTLVISQLIKRGQAFNVPKTTLVKAQNFVISLPSDTPTYSFYERLLSRSSVLRDLAKQDMAENEAYTYLAVAGTTWGGKNIALRNRLKKYVGAASVEKWTATFADSSETTYLLATIRLLKKIGVHPKLGANASDAITRNLEQALVNNGAMHPRVSTVVEALDDDVRFNLSAKIWHLLVTARSPAPIASVVTLIPDVVKNSTSRSLSDLLNTVLTQALSANDANLVHWVRSIIQSRERDIKAALPAVNEFRSRVAAQARPPGLSRPLRAALKQLLELLPKPSKRPPKSKSGRP